ncbi:MAG: LCP family protein [Actinomycetota bacterium]|nr:LCP family protein [Actinomycetota bacterium]
MPREVVLRQRRRRRRTIIGITIFMIISTLITSSGVVYFRWRLGQIRRLKVPGLTDDASGQVMNVLLVGSDSRARLTGEAAAQAGKAQFGDSERSDTIMVLHVDPAKKQAAILSIPRDLYLPIAGTGKSGKVNSAFAIGGPERLIATVQQGLGIQINHFAEVDFVGFKDIVDSVGGVTIFVPAAARDAFSGLQISNPGCINLDGDTALAWVRSRHYEYLSQGKWIEDPRADIGRIERQQDFIRRMMKKAYSSGIANPITLNRLIGVGVNNLTLDSEMSTGDITSLAQRFKSLDPDSVQTLTLPGEGTYVGDQAVIMLDKAAAQGPLDVINGKTPEPPSPAATPPDPAGTASTPAPAIDASIEVLNASGTKGAAAKAADELSGANFKVSGTGDASDGLDRTVIRYGDGQEAKAEALAAAFNRPPDLTADSDVKADSLVLLVGTDYSGVRQGVSAGTPTTTTSVPTPTPVPDDAVARRGC